MKFNVVILENMGKNTYKCSVNGIVGKIYLIDEKIPYRSTFTFLDTLESMELEGDLLQDFEEAISQFHLSLEEARKRKQSILLQRLIDAGK